MSVSVQVIILSDSRVQKLRKITENCISSLKSSEDFEFDIFVVDNKSSFKGVKNIKIPEVFNYNRFMNIVAEKSDSDWIVFCNNDLIFHKGWFTELLKVNHDVMSSRCPNDERQKSVFINTFGNKIGYHFSGWCFTMRRSVYNKIGGLNEDYKFWCADNIVIRQLNEIGIKPCLVYRSVVTHLGSQTLELMPKKKELTTDLLEKFNKEFNINDNNNNTDNKQRNIR